jgi:phosphatidylglycerophosphate synthase
MRKTSYYFINAITLYRLLAAPVLVYLIFSGNILLFKWLLAFSFFTDLIDGFLARRYKVSSLLGARLDSIADDLTILAAIIGVFVFRFPFIKENFLLIGMLLLMYASQTIFALVKYGRISSFHTWLAKIAALLQGVFLILIFFLDSPPYLLFYTASVITFFDLLEEIILVYMLPNWQANVKGIYWVLAAKKKGPIRQ